MLTDRGTMSHDSLSKPLIIESMKMINNLGMSGFEMDFMTKEETTDTENTFRFFQGILVSCWGNGHVWFGRVLVLLAIKP